MLKRQNVLYHPIQIFHHQKNPVYNLKKIPFHLNEVSSCFHRIKNTLNVYLFVPGSLCITYSISTDDNTENSILTLHGKDSNHFVYEFINLIN